MICDSPGEYVQSEKTAQEESLGSFPNKMSDRVCIRSLGTAEEWSVREEATRWVARLPSKEQKGEGSSVKWC